MKKINPVLIFILVIGIALRFYGFPNIPFTYDELSAWGRTGYPDFSSLINEGVRGDGHPALIQVFLNYWRMLFGDSEIVFKLPFLLMGVACIYLVYLLGKKWFTETTGVLAASIVAVLQYTVMYSAIARPYISGLFFSMLMVLHWTNYFFGEGKRKDLVLYSFFALLCIYNHYFSLMFAVIVAFSGLFFLRKRILIEYLVAQIIVLILFIPHWGITKYQFSIGGVGGWLAKPDRSFFFNYLSYIFNFSMLLAAAVIVTVALSIVMRDKEWKQKNKFRIIALLWFIAPIAIGYWYSVNRNPVLQYSVLIFSFPFFLIFIFSFYSKLKLPYLAALATMIIGAGIYSLVVDRMHFQIFFNQPVERLVKNAIDFEKEHPGKKTVVIIQEPKKYMDYYLKKWNSNIEIASWNDLHIESYFQFEKYLLSKNADYVLCGNVPYDHLMVVRNEFPNLLKTEKGLNYDFQALAKNDTAGKIKDYDFVAQTNFAHPNSFWKFNPAFVSLDSLSGKMFYQMDSTQEYSPDFKFETFDFITDRNDILLASIHVSDVKPNSDARLSISFGDDGQQLFYQEKPFSYFKDSSATETNLVYAFVVRDFKFTHDNTPFKIYIWNRGKENFRIDEMKLFMMKGNPFIYGSIEPVPYSKF